MVNASASFTAQSFDMCTVEGVAGGNSAPGVVDALALPNKTCNLDDTSCGGNKDLKCDLTTISGDVCQCSANYDGSVPAGSDTCWKYSPCIRTPCKVCSDCLADMSVFAQQQLYTLDRAKLATNFSTYCAVNYTASQCAAAAGNISDTSKPLSFGKRAGQLCQAMGFCNATTLDADCTLSPTPTVNGSSVSLCKIEGVDAGSDLPGITTAVNGMAALPAATGENSHRCDSDNDCSATLDTDYMCDKTLTTDFCSCYKGQDSCRAIGTCVLKPRPSCERCLAEFGSILDPLASAAEVATQFGASCVLSRSSDSCNSAKQAIASSYKGNAGRRAGSICSLLGECVPSKLGK